MACIQDSYSSIIIVLLGSLYTYLLHTVEQKGKQCTIRHVYESHGFVKNVVDEKYNILQLPRKEGTYVNCIKLVVHAYGYIFRMSKQGNNMLGQHMVTFKKKK